MNPMSASRRWPPIAAVGVALVMVFLVLPNPLRIPQNNPTASAEYAPVPGKSEQADNGNFSQTGEASSPGIGSGGEGEGALPGQSLIPPQQYKPRQHSCFGNPAQQTEDPLSPPCVSFFEGYNGGRTWAGVTKDDIKVVFYNDLENSKLEGDMTQPWKSSDEASTHRSSYEITYITRTVKAQLRYFQRHYQTYGRTVKLIAVKSSGLTSTCDQRQGDADVVMLDENPFATVHLGDGAQCFMDRMADKHKRPVFGLNSDVKRSLYEDNRPYVWGFFPDQEAEAGWSASFICRKLYADKNGDYGKGKARAPMTNDADLIGRTRKFGFIYPTDSRRGDQEDELTNLLIKSLKSDCPRTETKKLRDQWFDEKRAYDASGDGAGGPEAPTIMRDFKAANITTVVCYCVPVPTELTVGTMQNAASAIAYKPEWYWDHMSRMFRAVWNQEYSDQTQPGFGVNHHWRNEAFHAQHHYQAYSEIEPGSTPNVRFNFDIYHLFLNLFQAIQAAGPSLTPETVERGMFTFRYMNRPNPYIPLGGYGSYEQQPDASLKKRDPKCSAVPGCGGILASQNVAPYNFVDTAMGWWWDPDGTPPGGQSGEGCVRVMDQGLRYFRKEWRFGDKDLFVDAPCSQDDVELRESRGAF